MGKVGKFLFGQKKTGRQWGTIVQVAQQGMIFVSFINLFLLAITAYSTTISPYLQGRGIYIPFLYFILVLVLLLVLGGSIAWKYALPSYFSAFNSQFYRHENPLKKDIEEIKEQNRIIMGKLNDWGGKISEASGADKPSTKH